MAVWRRRWRWAILSSSVPLAKVTLIANRQASNLNIGDVFKFTWPELGIPTGDESCASRMAR